LFLDADCEITPDHFEIMHPYLSSHKHKLLSIRERPMGNSWIQKIGSPSKRVLYFVLGKLFAIPVIHAGCLYMRGKSFSSLKGFNPESLCEDIDLGIRVGMPHIQLINKPIVTEISDRRLSRLGLFSTIGIPARCTAMMFLSYNIVPTPAAQSLSKNFLKLGKTHMPVHLWWNDPNRTLQITRSAALKTFFLWIQLLIYLQIGLIKPKESPSINRGSFSKFRYYSRTFKTNSNKSKIIARD